MITGKSLSELKVFLKELQINEEDDHEEHALGNYGRVTIFPKTEQEISSILEYANTNKHSVTIMGGGTINPDNLLNAGKLFPTPGHCVEVKKERTLLRDLEQ
ncbi:hypothetical protein SAMN05443253_110130 [Bacillus sp. OK048]|nr:hypothetical protein SAMN05443253_110130 [Bacillus sp. OK048]